MLVVPKLKLAAPTIGLDHILMQRAVVGQCGVDRPHRRMQAKESDSVSGSKKISAFVGMLFLLPLNNDPVLTHTLQRCGKRPKSMPASPAEVGGLLDYTNSENALKQRTLPPIRRNPKMFVRELGYDTASRRPV